MALVAQAVIGAEAQPTAEVAEAAEQEITEAEADLA
jgi:hypothetical protein